MTVLWACGTAWGWANTSWKNLEQTDKTSLWAWGEGAVSLCTWRRVLLYWDCTWKSVPPAESTTSVSREPWQSFSAEAKNVSWWSFHRRQKFSPILSNLHSAMARRLERLEVVVAGGGWETGGGVNR